MGSGGVAIAALPTVICFKVTFSDGLGGPMMCGITALPPRNVSQADNKSPARSCGRDLCVIYI